MGKVGHVLLFGEEKAGGFGPLPAQGHPGPRHSQRAVATVKPRRDAHRAAPRRLGGVNGGLDGGGGVSGAGVVGMVVRHDVENGGVWRVGKLRFAVFIARIGKVMQEPARFVRVSRLPVFGIKGAPDALGRCLMGQRQQDNSNHGCEVMDGVRAGGSHGQPFSFSKCVVENHTKGWTNADIWSLAGFADNAETRVMHRLARLVMGPEGGAGAVGLVQPGTSPHHPAAVRCGRIFGPCPFRHVAVHVV